jgi:hypothetical protein
MKNNKLIGFLIYRSIFLFLFFQNFYFKKINFFVKKIKFNQSVFSKLVKPVLTSFFGFYENQSVFDRNFNPCHVWTYRFLCFIG